jgi:stage II sporulation protein R
MKTVKTLKTMKMYRWLLFAVLILVMSWEDQRSVAALYTQNTGQGQQIPEQSIRLRIIANSDSPQDQSLKRQVRDDINAYLSEKVIGSNSMKEARMQIEEELPELQKIVNNTIAQTGYEYTSKVEMGTVPFPTKMYGQYVYPAGDYEALRVTIGNGLGQNWWCVLFPPLCFVDISTGDAVRAEQPSENQTGMKSTIELAAGEQGLPKIEVRFIFIEWIEKLWNMLFGK